MGNKLSHSEDKKTLTVAIESGDLESIQHIVTSHPEFFKSKLQKESGNTPIHVAVLLKDYAVLKLFITFSNRGDESNEVHEAAVRAISHGRKSDGVTPLMLSCDIGDEESFKLLLLAGANPWVQDHNHHRTCLHYVAVKNHARLIAPLVEFSRKVNKTAEHASGLFQKFSRISNAEQAEEVNTSKPLIDISTFHGFTPMMYAAWFDHGESVVGFMQAGAQWKLRCWPKDPNCDAFCKDVPEGSTALHVAAINGAAHAVYAILTQFMLSLSPAEGERSVSEASPAHHPLDPRLMVDCDGHTAFQMARLRRQFQLLPLLNPTTPLDRVFDMFNPEARLVGVPSLLKIAAQAAQKVLMLQLEGLRKAIAKRKQQRNNRDMMTKSGSRRQNAQGGVGGLARLSSLRPSSRATSSVAHITDKPAPLKSTKSMLKKVPTLKRSPSYYARPGQQPDDKVNVQRLRDQEAHVKILEAHERDLHEVVKKISRLKTSLDLREQDSLSEGDPLASLSPDVDPEQADHLLDAYRAHRLVHGVEPGSRSQAAAGQWQLMPGQVPSNQEEPDAQQNPRSSLSINNPRLVLSGLSASAGYIHSRTSRHHAYPNKVGQALQDSLKDQPGVPASSAAAELSLVWASSTDTSMSAAAPPSSFIAASISKTSGGVGDRVPEEQQQQQQQDVEEVSSCGVCLDDKGEIVVTKPCGHKMCVDCAMELLKLHAYDPSPCPFCRSIIRGFMG